MASVGPTRPEPGETGSLSGSSEKLSSSAVNRMLMEFLMYFGRAVFLFYPVYLTGYLGLSISWVLLCMMMITWYQKNRQWKDARIGSAIQFVDNETDTINEELKGALQMASWVHFTDVEKANWLNKVLEQAWPFFGMYMEKLLKENIQPVVRQSNGALKMFNFTKVHFGHIPPKITGIKAFTHEVDHREVILDMNLQGMIRVILEPLIGQAPLVGGVTFFFIRRPTLQINWTGMTNLLDSPAFSSLSEDAIMDIIASLMVLPNRMCIPLIDQVKVDQMRFPLPRGVVRVHLLEARDLVAKDTYMMGMVKGKSDPYATLRVGNRSVKSKTIKENLHPKWGEVYEFVVHEAPGQELEVELFDEDTDKDDFIGSDSLISFLQWFPLEGVPYGEIHLKLQWLSLQSDSSLLTEVPYPQTSPVPRSWRSGRELLDLLMSDQALPDITLSIHLSLCLSLQVKYASKDPVWEEGFTFFIRNARTQQLKVQVKEHEKKTQLGVLNIPLTRLLETSDMTLDQRFPLDRSGASSHIKMKVTLRVGTHTHTHTRTHRYSLNFCGFCISWRIKLSLLKSYLQTRHRSRALRNHQGSLGEIELSVRYATLRKKLIVLVNSCRNIFPCSENGTDSYVRMYLLPNQSWIHRKRTHVKKKTVNPVFNDKFEYDVTLEEAQTRMLDVSVKNNRLFHRRERKDIGMVLIDLSQLDLVKGVTQWYTTTLFSLFT
uniref:Extended synaptotagmin-3-like n=1 Tax=Salarias fasciatus TaxID=181472 RepID=A0A672IDM4_SALFA